MEMPPTKQTKGGVRIVDSSKFKVATTAMALVTVHPGVLRELHWHPNADEWQYFIAGMDRMTVVATGNKARTMNFQQGDVGYVQNTLLHYVENTGIPISCSWRCSRATATRTFRSRSGCSHPAGLVMAHLRIDRATFDTIPKEGIVVTPR